LVESLEGFLGDGDLRNNVNDFRDSIGFVLEFSEELVESGLDSIPSGELGGEVFLSNGKISLSLLSEGFGVGDVLDALGEGGSVVDNSLSGIINSLLGDGHEVGVSRKLVGFSGLGVSNTLEHLGSDGSELLSKSTEHLGVSEIGELEESFDHGTIFGVLKGLRDLLERSLDFGDLDEGGSSGVETGEELNALINSIDSHVGFLDVSDVLGVRSGSLGGGSVHIGEGVDDELLISGNLGFEGGLEWVEDVLKGRGGGSDIGLSAGNSLSDGGFPLVVLGELDVVVLSVDIHLELVISVEVLEGLDQVTNW